MKRVISLIIMVLYLLPALGITVSAHYCSGKLADVSLLGSKSKMTCACGANSAKGKVSLKKKCCEQVSFSLKLDNQQLKQSTLDHKSPNAEILAVKLVDFGFIRNTIIVMPKVALSYSPNLPPGRYKEPIYIQNDSFLI